MNSKSILSLIVFDLLVMLFALGLMVIRYRSLNVVPAPLPVVRTKQPAATRPLPETPSTAGVLPEPSVPKEPAAASTDETRNIAFVFRHSKANKVEVIGDFNGWIPQPMIKGQDYRWSITIPIPPGEYAYNFVLDGRPIRDPYNQRTVDVGRGFPNSLLKVRSRSDEKNKSE
jgi:hypothetical protein